MEHMTLSVTSPNDQLFLSRTRYDHFDRGDRSNKCVLFRDEDYLPPAQERDIEGVDTIEEIESVMQTKCPRCNKVQCIYTACIHGARVHGRVLVVAIIVLLSELQVGLRVPTPLAVRR